MNKVFGFRSVRSGFADLLCNPDRCWISGDVEVLNFSAIVTEDQKDKERFEGQRRDYEKIHCPDFAAVIEEKIAPGLLAILVRRFDGAYVFGDCVWSGSVRYFKVSQLFVDFLGRQ